MSERVVFTPPFKALVDGVSKYLAANGVNAVVERALGPGHIKPIAGRSGRIVFYGSKPDGSAGACVNPRQVGDHEYGGDATADPPIPPKGTWRPLSDWARIFYVTIWAIDIDRPSDEGAQDDAVYQLFTWTQRAVQSVAFGNAVWGNTRFVVPTDLAHGLELQAELSLQIPIPDVPEEYTRPNPVMSKPA